MNLLLVGLALITAAVLSLLLFKRPSARAPAPARPARPLAAPSVAVSIAPVSVRTAPPELAGFQRNAAAALAPERRAGYVSTFREVPRPPKLLQHLMSPEFLNAANSAQLVELINAEPLIAAKVLAAVNSPLYGLKSPVSSAGQAVTYLGLNVVRSLCLQYILISAFKADSPERQQVLESTWRTSALASELCHQLSYRLALPEAGLGVSAVVLSFLGRLATAATMPRALLASVPARDHLMRSQAEQAHMGLCAGEIGRLLMAEWGLPERIVAAASDIDTLLVTPHDPGAGERGSRLALGYLCARLAERLVGGELHDLLAFDLDRCNDAELHHLHSYLAEPALARLGEYLRAPMLSADLQRMLAAWRH